MLRDSESVVGVIEEGLICAPPPQARQKGSKYDGELQK